MGSCQVMKEHAKDYLIEFANKSADWLKILITDAISTNSNISEEKLNTIHNVLLYGNTENTEIVDPLPEPSQIQNKIILTKLTHIGGVNAINANQKVKFSNETTILYGLNGSGKSSYFKILNEIVGGNIKKEIIGNIFQSSNLPIEVELEFKDGNNSQLLEWNNTTRAITPLDQVKVFDSSYLNGFLGKRESDTTLVQPFGLNLFPYIISKIDELKTRINNSANEEDVKKPVIDCKQMREDYNSIFSKNKYTNARKSIIQSLYSFPDTSQNEIETISKAIKDLEQNNIQDKIKLEDHNKDTLVKIQNELTNNFQTLNSEIINTKNLLSDYKSQKESSDKYKKQLKVLETIPETNSENWKKFIKTAKDYSTTVADSNNTCIYCRQPLTNDAIELISAYTSYLTDESEENLANTIELLGEKLELISNLNFSIEITNDIEEILKTKVEINNEEARLIDLIKAAKQDFNEKKKIILNYIKTKTYTSDILLQDISQIESTLAKKIAKTESNITNFGEDDKNKGKQILLLKAQLLPIIEHKAISKQKVSISQWFNQDEKSKLLKKTANAIKTTQLSTLAKKANSDLLTENLKTKFLEELKSLCVSNMEVKLEGAGTRKGKASTKLTITNKDEVTAILSEGEQKAVGLALFLAEASMQKQANPIILDDPVNSLDHRIASFFADRLLELDNQVIVFTHNKLFLDAFETSKKGGAFPFCRNLTSTVKACNIGHWRPELFKNIS